MHRILTASDDDQRLLVNWNNGCSVASRGADEETLHARLHFDVTVGTGALSIDLVEDIDEIAELLQAAREVVVEIDEEDDAKSSRGPECFARLQGIVYPLYCVC
jgi:hypothetical protein